MSAAAIALALLAAFFVGLFAATAPLLVIR